MKDKTLIIENENLKNFLLNEKKKTKNLYRYIIIFIIIIDIILFLFFIIINQQKKKLLLEVTNFSKEINKNDFEVFSLSNKINKYLVNLKNKKLTDIILNKEEYLILFDWINFFKINLCYKGSIEGEYSKQILLNCLNTSNQILLLIKIENGKRFGGYINNNNDNSFLFSLNKKKNFYIKKENNISIIKEDNIINFNEDLIINPNWKNGKKNYCSFPKNYGNEIKDSIYDLNGGLKNFDIIELEFYSII